MGIIRFNIAQYYSFRVSISGPMPIIGTSVWRRFEYLAAAVQRTTIEKEVQNTGNGTLPSKLPFFSLRLTKSESGHAFSLIRQKSTWWLVGKMMILPHFTLLMLSSYRLVMAHLDSGSRYIVWYFIDIEYRHLVSDSLTPLVSTEFCLFFLCGLLRFNCIT